MWKYVSRRVKDTLERTCNVLDVGRTSFCSSGAANGDVSCGGAAASLTPSDSQVLVYKKGSGCVTWFRDGCGRFSEKHGNPDEEQAGQERKERERLHYQDGIAQSWLSALTWVSVICKGQRREFRPNHLFFYLAEQRYCLRLVHQSVHVFAP